MTKNEELIRVRFPGQRVILLVETNETPGYLQIVSSDGMTAGEAVSMLEFAKMIQMAPFLGRAIKDVTSGEVK